MTHLVLCCLPDKNLLPLKYQCWKKYIQFCNYPIVCSLLLQSWHKQIHMVDEHSCWATAYQVMHDIKAVAGFIIHIFYVLRICIKDNYVWIKQYNHTSFTRNNYDINNYTDYFRVTLHAHITVCSHDQPVYFWVFKVDTTFAKWWKNYCTNCLTIFYTSCANKVSKLHYWQVVKKILHSNVSDSSLEKYPSLSMKQITQLMADLTPVKYFKYFKCKKTRNQYTNNAR
jgi:hypothetical protein